MKHSTLLLSAMFVILHGANLHASNNQIATLQELATNTLIDHPINTVDPLAPSVMQGFSFIRNPISGQLELAEDSSNSESDLNLDEVMDNTDATTENNASNLLSNEMQRNDNSNEQPPLRYNRITGMIEPESNDSQEENAREIEYELSFIQPLLESLTQEDRNTLNEYRLVYNTNLRRLEFLDENQNGYAFVRDSQSVGLEEIGGLIDGFDLYEDTYDSDYEADITEYEPYPALVIRDANGDEAVSTAIRLTRSYGAMIAPLNQSHDHYRTRSGYDEQRIMTPQLSSDSSSDDDSNPSIPRGRLYRPAE